ncbi:MAG TPA: UDP-N-acetylmuramoyl-L-alanyl-D-glutamate--2,6-diaminopimelate ligase [Candidatus Gracilibacteria bacterium]|nr:UDP-N-acetylmuramoyl-L-alanyl-D-glutamate--2,6-diaminopimelate ligase [Candidatus Gracilibacteria bacterium]
MIKFLKSKISDTNPLRLLYHKVMAIIACLYYRFPSRYLNVIAVTGTKGKTTTTNLIAGILTEAGYKVGMTSTINFQVGDRRWTNATKITTLGPFVLQKLLRQMVDERCTHAVLEVSSHSILQNRIWGVNVDTAVITNIGEDHLDYHGGAENYLRTKGLLFSRLNRSQRKARIQKVAVINKDEAHFQYFDQFIADRKFTYGMGGGTCFATDMSLVPSGSKFTLNIPNNRIDVTLNLPGEFNVYNALAAATVGLANNINITTLKDALEKTSTIPGRFEAIDCGQKYHIVVDYAHTEQSLESLLKLYKSLTKGKLYVVFGATGGGRDKAKRPKMGAAADEHADYIIVTDDDPYEEDEYTIVEDVSAGVKREEGDRFWKIPNREEAIKLALTMARENDTVVVAGKGAEELQMIHGKAVPWDDRKVIRALLSREMRVEIHPGKTQSAENVFMKA